MDFLLFIHILYILYRSDLYIAKNNPPNCKGCKYFKFSLSGHEFSKCTKFGTVIRDTNVIRYEYADLSRLDEDKCGPKARYYENKKIKDMLDIITEGHNHNNYGNLDNKNTNNDNKNIINK